MKTELDTKNFLTALMMADIITLDTELSEELGYDAVYVENHAKYDLYYNLNATEDTLAEDLLRILDIRQDGYDFYCTTDGMDNQSFLDFDVEHLVIKKSIQCLGDID